MRQARSWVCLLAFCILVAWMSPLGHAEPGKAGNSGAININTAPVEELVKLPKVGQKVAERIVEYRSQHGEFKQLEDLKAVQGIGDKVFENIRPMITLK
jgi:competence protein ComEA